MTFFTPGKPYLDSDAQPPLSPLVMQQQHSHYGYGQGVGMGQHQTALRRIPSTAGGGAGNKKTRAPPENKPSVLLGPEENLLVFDVLGKGRQTLSTAVVQLLYPTADNFWKLRDVGVLCFVRDSNRRSYFLDIISLRMSRLIFSQEIYEEFVYRQPNPRMRFLTFEGDEFMVGLSFASGQELSEFRATLDNKMNAKRRRQVERQRSLYEQAATTVYATPATATKPQNSPTITSAHMHSMLAGLAAPISPYATARPAPANASSPISATNKFNTVSGSSPYAKMMASGAGGSSGAGRGGVSSFGTSTLRAQQSPYAHAAGIGKVPMSPISIPKIQTSQVAAGPPGQPAAAPASEPIMSSITLSRPPAGKKPSRFGGRRNSIASAFAANNANAHAYAGKQKAGSGGGKGEGKKGKGKGKKEKLTTLDIGLPMNFVHVQHAGFDRQKGFTNNVLDERYKALFDKVGISAQELQDDGTRKFIYEFIDQYEQENAAVRGAKAGPPPPGAQQAGAQRPAPTPTGPVNPPPVPARAAEKKQAPTPPPPTKQPQQQTRYNGQQAAVSAAVPPPPPIAGLGMNNGLGYAHHAPSPSPQLTRHAAAALPQPQRQGVAATAVPPPPPMPMATTPNDEEEPGEPRPGAGPSASPTSAEGGRVNLLKEIQAGISLRKVEDHKLALGEGSLAPARAESMDGLAGALARALAERSRAIHSDSSSDEDDEGGRGATSDDSDEWK